MFLFDILSTIVRSHWQLHVHYWHRVLMSRLVAQIAVWSLRQSTSLAPYANEDHIAMLGRGTSLSAPNAKRLEAHQEPTSHRSLAEFYSVDRYSRVETEALLRPADIVDHRLSSNDAVISR